MKPGDLIHYHPPGYAEPIVGVLVEKLNMNPRRKYGRISKPLYQMKLLGPDGVVTYDVTMGIHMPLIIDEGFVP